MSQRTKRQMAPPPDQDRPAPTPAPAYQTGSAPAPTLHSSAHIPALLCGGATVPTPGGQSGNPLGDLFLYTRLLVDPC